MAVRAIKPNVWQIDYYPAGQHRRVRLAFVGSHDDALLYEMELKRCHRKGPGENAKIADAIPDWLEHAENHMETSTFTDVKKCLKSLIPHFGNKFFRLLSQADIESYKTQRLKPKGEKKVKKRTVNKELAYMASFFAWAKENEYLPSGLGFSIKYFKYKRPKPLILSKEEVLSLYTHLDDRYKLIFLLLYLCGLRRTEALTLKVENVDIPNRTIRIRGKNGEEEILPIVFDEMVEMLATVVRERQKGFLSVNPKTGKPYCAIRKALLRAAKAANITKRVNHHLLRHCFGAHATEAGVNTRALQELMRHKSVSQTEWYSQVCAEHKKKEGQKLKEFVGELPTKAPEIEYMI